MESKLLEESTIPTVFEVRDKPPSNKSFVTSLMVPALFIFIVVILFPIIIGIFISFRNSNGITGYYGTRFNRFNNYNWLLFDGGVVTRNFWQYTYQTLFFAIVSLFLEFGLGIWFAKLLNKKFKGRGLARATILIPWALPTIASATIFRYEIFAPADQYGLVNNLLQLLSLQPVAFFGPDAEVLFKLPVLVPYDTGVGGLFPFVTEIDITTTMFTAIAIDVWKTTPFLTLLILAVLQIVPEDLNSAADIAGASGWQKFRYITWPLIKSGVGVALIFRMMDALRVYDAIVVFRDAEVRSMTWHAADLWLNAQEYGLASTVAILLFIFIIAFYFIISKFTKGKSEEPIKPISKRKKDYEETTNPSGEFNSIYSFSPSDRRINEFSESKIKWIRIKLLLNRGLFSFSVIFMCLFCATPFIWIIIRSFRDPFIPQTNFETFNLTIAITLILFVISLFFIISNISWKRSKRILGIISIISFFCFIASPFILLIMRSPHVPSIPSIIILYSYVVITIMIGLLFFTLYIVFVKFWRGTTKNPNDRSIKENKFEKRKNSSKSLLTNGGTPKIESNEDLFSVSAIKSKIAAYFKLNYNKPIFWIKLIILIGSIFFIIQFGMYFPNWLRSDRLSSFNAFQVVFETSEFTGVSFDRALFNGFVLSGLTVVVVLIIGSLIAYALAKFDFSGKWIINSFIFSMTSLPPIIIIIPYFIQTNTISDLFSGQTNLMSLLFLLLGIVLIILNIVIYRKYKNYKKKLFILTLGTIIILFTGLFLYIRFSPLFFIYKNTSLSLILIMATLFLLIDTVIYIAFRFLNRNYNWKLFILSLIIIVVIFWSFYDFVNTSGDPFDLRDNKYGLLLPYSALNLPLAVFVLQAFFREIPEDLWKAAKVDGASNFQIFRKIILPLTIPGVFTCAILVFIASWNELLFAQIWLVNDANHTVPRAILRFVQSPLSLTADWDTDIALMAATTIATVPLVIIVLIFQRKIISGLTRGAVKG